MVPTSENNWAGFGAPPGEDYYLDRDGNSTGVKGWIKRPGAASSSGGASGATGGGGIGGGGLSLPKLPVGLESSGPPEFGGVDVAADKIRVRMGDVEGLNFAKGPEERVWSRLDNVYFFKSGLRRRPSLFPVGPAAMPETSKRGSGGVIDEIPANDTQPLSENLVPNATNAAGAWTATGAATLHEAVDDNPPSDSATVASTTATDVMELAFGDLTKSYTVIDGVTLRIRATSLLSGVDTLLRVLSAAGNEWGEIRVSGVGEVAEAGALPNYVDYELSLFLDPDTDNPFTVADIDALALQFENKPSPQTTEDFSAVTATGIDTGASADPNDYNNSQTIDMLGFVWLSDIAAVDFVAASFPPLASGARQSWVFAAPSQTFSSISQVTLSLGIRAGASSIPIVEIYHVGTDSVRRVLATTTVLSVPSDFDSTGSDPGAILAAGNGLVVFTESFGTNPQTSAAWTPAQVAAGLEFGIRVLTPDAVSIAPFIGLTVQGVIDNAATGVRIAAINLDVFGQKVEGDAGPAQGRLVLTSGTFARLDSQNASGLTDVRGTVALSGASGLERWDSAALFGKMYFVNGVDQTYLYPKAITNRVMDQLSGAPVGRTCMAFGNRLMIGDVTEDGVRSEERVRYSAIVGFGGAANWDDDTAGDFDLVQGGKGPLVKLLPLSAQLGVGYRALGIYNISWTGRNDVPFIPQMMTGFHGCKAKGSVRAVMNSRGALVHLFLGWGPEGFSVYEYNGGTARLVGDAIQSKLESDLNHELSWSSFAVHDPARNLYILFVPEGTQVAPEQAWVYEVRRERWTRWTFPQGVQAAGLWTLPASANWGSLVLSGRTQVVLLMSNGQVMRLIDGKPADTYVGSTLPEFANSAAAYNVPYAPVPIDGTKQRIDHPPAAIPVNIQTGDWLLSGDPTRKTISKALWASYVDHGKVGLRLSEGASGAEEFVSEDNFSIGGYSFAGDPERVRTVILGLTPLESYRHRLRLRSQDPTFNDYTNAGLGDLDLLDLTLTFGPGGSF